ncbi:MAG: tripartite tricarboxylate transporter TctB family protein [Casimicrobiaceae bacterium]
MTEAPSAAGNPRHVTRLAAEVFAALLTLALSAAIVLGARGDGIGWTTGGPEAGTFPFYVGLIIGAASLGNLVMAFRRTDRAAVLLDAIKARRIAAFGIPLLLFVAASVTLGFYVATILYLTGVMRVQGRYRWITSIAVGVGCAAFFYIVLEMWFTVPLRKGPLESMLGIH